MQRLLVFADLRPKGIKWGRNYIREKEKKGQFPKRVKFGPNARDHGWVESEIDDYIASLIAARDNPSPEVIAAKQVISNHARYAAKKSLAKQRRKRASEQAQQIKHTSRKRRAARPEATNEAVT